MIIITVITMINKNNNNNSNMCQPGLGAYGASLSSPGRLVLRDMIGVSNRQMVNVRQDHKLQEVLHW